MARVNAFTYYGGKSRLLPLLVDLIPHHKIYCEPYFGGGALFFAKSPSYMEVINDMNEKLITFYMVLRDDFDRLHELVSDTIMSEAIFDWARDIYYEKSPSDWLTMAYAVWIVFSYGYGGSVSGGFKFDNGTSGSHHGRTMKKRRDEFQYLKGRLEYVHIMKRPALDLIISRDTKNTFFFLDPPYIGADHKHYTGLYSEQDEEDLIEVLTKIEGKFMLTAYSSAFLLRVSDLCGWTVRENPDKRTLINHRKRKGSEVIICNYQNSTLFSQ